MTEHQEYEINALKNNTFDFVSLGETLKELRESSFNFLYSLQRDSVGIKRFDFTFADLKMLDMNHYSLKIATDFIRPDAKLKYRSSNLYRKEIKKYVSKLDLYYTNQALIDKYFNKSGNDSIKAVESMEMSKLVKIIRKSKNDLHNLN